MDTNPKRERGCGASPSLTLRVSITRCVMLESALGTRSVTSNSVRAKFRRKPAILAGDQTFQQECDAALRVGFAQQVLLILRLQRQGETNDVTQHAQANVAIQELVELGENGRLVGKPFGEMLAELLAV